MLQTKFKNNSAFSFYHI